MMRFSQPLTALQVASREKVSLDTASYLLRELRCQRLVRCLTPDARQSRVYWLTPAGEVAQEDLRRQAGLSRLTHFVPRIDWELYGCVCFSHRSSVLLVLEEPLQPAAIKRRARLQNPGLRMSANNVRDVIRVLLKRGVVESVRIRGRFHPRYRLTETGGLLQELLRRAATRGESR